MGSPKSDAGSARRALWLGGLMLTLAGLFGMHGLASHGTAELGAGHAGHPAMAASSMHWPGASKAAVTDPSAHAGHATTAGTVVVSAATALSAPVGGMGMDMGGAALCLAVLLLTALALLVGASLRGVAPVLFLRARPVRAPVTRTHVPHPPDLYALSIQRC